MQMLLTVLCDACWDLGMRSTVPCAVSEILRFQYLVPGVEIVKVALSALGTKYRKIFKFNRATKKRTINRRDTARIFEDDAVGEPCV